MEDGHRLVGQVQPLHLDGGGGILFLELDHRRGDLALQLFLHLVLLGLAYSADQADFGRHPGVAGDAVCQQLFKAHLLQKLRAVAHPDGDALPQDGDAAPVQKAVDGHAVRLHFLQQVPQGRFVQRGIAEVVLDLQFKALIIRLQRGQQPGAQALVQRGGAAQGKMTCWLCRSMQACSTITCPKQDANAGSAMNCGQSWETSGVTGDTPFIQHKLPRLCPQAWQQRKYSVYSL